MAAARLGALSKSCSKQFNFKHLNNFLSSKSRFSLLENNFATGLARYGSHHNYPMPDIPSKEVARNFVVNLDDDGRSFLYKELLLFEEKENKSDKNAVSPKVTRAQLRMVFTFNAVPFLGFGLLDNLIMIVAGEYIDATLGLALGISTMAAAGLGNLVSDVIGVGTAGYVEVLASKIGIVSPDITPEQADAWQTRWMIALGRGVGISVGCFIGMFPLLFIGNKDEEDESEQESSSNQQTQSESSSTQPPQTESNPNINSVSSSPIALSNSSTSINSISASSR